jgi:hypothetical protein
MGAAQGITRATIVADAHRFSKLHAWFKQIPYPGAVFIVFFARGEQRRNGIEVGAPESEPLHLHVISFKDNEDRIERLPASCRRYPVVLTKELGGSDEKARLALVEHLVAQAVRVAEGLQILAKQ